MTVKNYKLRDGVSVAELLKCGFELRGNVFRMSRPLYKYSDSNSTYVYLRLSVDLNAEIKLGVSVETVSGEFYAPFYNEDYRNQNLVYEKVVENYYNVMDGLVKRKILNVVKEKKKNGKR